MLTPFLTGLLGSLHCAGMCGPLAMALPGQAGAKGNFLAGRLAYNSGRIFSYMLLGGLVSLLGLAAALFQVQQYVSLFLGILMVFLAIRSMVRHRNKRHRQGRLHHWVYGKFSYFMSRPVPGRLFLLGALNGLLPCGLVYIGLFQAALASNPLQGMGIMAAFGLGTYPVMLSFSLTGAWIRRKLSGKGHLVLPSLMLGMGLMLSVRGMALGIPYLSPRVEMQATEQHKHRADPEKGKPAEGARGSRYNPEWITICH